VSLGWSSVVSFFSALIWNISGIERPVGFHLLFVKFGRWTRIQKEAHELAYGESSGQPEIMSNG